MKVGDLVELSARGKKGNQNYGVKNRVGIIISIEQYCTTNNLPKKHPYEIYWFGKNVHPQQKGNILPCSRYEIKFAKKHRKK